jgi:hypothetical protein
MDHLPLTRSAPFTEIPEFPAAAGIGTLFPELAPSGARPVEVTVTVPERGGRRCVMHIVTAEDNAGDAFSLAVRGLGVQYRADPYSFAYPLALILGARHDGPASFHGFSRFPG